MTGGGWSSPSSASTPGADGIDLDAVLDQQPVTAGVERESIDSVLAALAGFYLAGALADTPAAFRPIAAAKLELGRGALCWLERRLPMA